MKDNPGHPLGSTASNLLGKIHAASWTLYRFENTSRLVVRSKESFHNLSYEQGIITWFRPGDQIPKICPSRLNAAIYILPSNSTTMLASFPNSCQYSHCSDHSTCSHRIYQTRTSSLSGSRRSILHKSVHSICSSGPGSSAETVALAFLGAVTRLLA